MKSFSGRISGYPANETGYPTGYRISGATLPLGVCLACKINPSLLQSKTDPGDTYEQTLKHRPWAKMCRRPAAPRSCRRASDRSVQPFSLSRLGRAIILKMKKK